jgi:hypothetical protein
MSSGQIRSPTPHTITGIIIKVDATAIPATPHGPATIPIAVPTGIATAELVIFASPMPLAWKDALTRDLLPPFASFVYLYGFVKNFQYVFLTPISASSASRLLFLLLLVVLRVREMNSLRNTFFSKQQRRSDEEAPCFGHKTTQSFLKKWTCPNSQLS